MKNYKVRRLVRKQRMLVQFYTFLNWITKKDRIIDITGVILTPGNDGKDCKGNGEHRNWRRQIIECCCDECDFYIGCQCDEEGYFISYEGEGYFTRKNKEEH